MPDRSSLAKYLEAKYFRGLHPEVEREIFKALWKFSFRLENPDTLENREINIRTLHLLFERKPVELRDFVQAQQPFFSEVSEGAPLDALIPFLAAHPTIFGALSDAAKVLVENRAKATVDLFAIATFLAPTFAKHIEAVLGHPQRLQLSSPVYEELMLAARKAGCAERLCTLGAEIYGASVNFNTADSNFANFIAPYLEDYDGPALEVLLKEIEGNSQTHWRGSARVDHPRVHARCREVFGKVFDAAKYAGFSENVKPAL